MRLRGPAAREEARQASQYRDDDRVMTELFARFPRSDEYEFDIDDVGRVLETVHYPERNNQGKLRDMFAYWMKWIEGPIDESRSDRSIHLGMVETLRRGRALPKPILQGEWEIHDGRHRFFAMFHVYRGSPDFRTNVYWVHDWENGVSAHLARQHGER